MLRRRNFLTGLLAASTRARAGEAVAIWPILQGVGPSDAFVVWHSAGFIEPTVEWSSAEEDQWRRADIAVYPLREDPGGAESFRFKYEANLEGLPPGTEIRYRIRAGASPAHAPEFRFRTPSPTATRLRAVAFGDSGSTGEAQRRLIHGMAADKPALALHTGDTAYPLADFPHLQEHYLAPLSGLMASLPLYPCLGNHDTAAGGSPLLWLHKFPAEPELPARLRARNYRFRYGPAEFFAIDTNESLMNAGEDLLAWLDAALEDSRAFWRVVFLHHTPYPGARHAADVNCAAVRERLVPLIERHAVPLALCGHHHSYRRTAAPPPGEIGTLWVTTGGGGGGLYDEPVAVPNVEGRVAHHYMRLDFDGYRLTVSAIGLEGETLDEVVLQPPPRIECFSHHRDGTIRLLGRHLALTSATPAKSLQVFREGQEAEVITASPTEIRLRSSSPIARFRIETPNGAVEQPSGCA
jgi:hypothetical protein